MKPSPLRLVPWATALSLTVAAAWAGEEPTKSAASGPSTSEVRPAPASKRGARPGDVQKVFVLQHANAEGLAKILSVFPAELSYSDRSLWVLGVSAPPAVVTVIEDVVRRLDVPPPPTSRSRPVTVEIVGHVLESSAGPQDIPLPEDLEKVVAQLRTTLRHSTYSLAATLLARTQNGAEFQVAAPPLAEGAQAARGYTLAGRPIIRSEAGRPVVTMEKLDFGAMLGPGDVERIRTAVTLGNDEHAVVGTTIGKGGKALILVLSAKITD